MLFNSVKEINRLINEISRLLSKGMLNIYLKVTFKEKNWRSQNLRRFKVKVFMHFVKQKYKL